jgi:hypothetical protein
VQHFENQQERDRLQTVVATVHIIALGSKQTE